MIVCYACNQWKPGDIAPFAVCKECESEATEYQNSRDLREARLELPGYWQMAEVWQDRIRRIAIGQVEVQS